MRAETWFGRLTIYIMFGAGSAVAASGQQLAPGIGSYYNYPYRYHPNTFFDTAPRPPTGSYVPYQRVPPFPFYTLPPGGVLVQPYPYGYQPPLYQPYSYARPYYSPGSVRPPYYGGPYPYLGPRYQSNRLYYPRVRQWQNVDPVGSETSLGRYIMPLQDRRDGAGSAAAADPNKP